jgi:catechol 2,3-dioxygenase-like lactoylglutathione lyase family enzyme
MSNERSIDHIVVAVADLDRAAARYEGLGFRLTPRARHPDSMGTSNRLAQLRGMNFIELLEVDRPDRLDDHAFAASPKRFSFGAHNRAFLRAREGMSMLVLATTDARGDLARFQAAGIDTYAPFDFERKATLPDGSQVTVAFSLVFATHPLLPGMAFFVCENRFPQYFWKPEFQTHANGAQSIAAVYIQAEAPDALVPFLTALTAGQAERIDGGQRISCGAQELIVITPQRMRETVPAGAAAAGDGPAFAGVAMTSNSVSPHVVPASDACGLFLEWRAA